MAFLRGRPMSRAESDAQIDVFQSSITAHGYGFWAMELRDTGELIGLAGLLDVRFEAAFTPAIEIGWRLSHAHWGKGFATEAAGAALDFAFASPDQDGLGLETIIAMTVHNNVRSRRVMERLGMTRDPADDFDHPNLAEDDPLRPHVLYRISRAQWSR